MFEFIFGYVKWIYVNIIDTVCDYEVFLVPAILFSIIFFVQRQPKVEYVNGEDIKMWVSSSEEVMNVIEKKMELVIYYDYLVLVCRIYYYFF